MNHGIVALEWTDITVEDYGLLQENRDFSKTYNFKYTYISKISIHLTISLSRQDWGSSSLSYQMGQKSIYSVAEVNV